MTRDLLAPQPMSEDEVRDLVERARVATDADMAGTESGRRASNAAAMEAMRKRRNQPHQARAAVRFAHYTRTPLSDAARYYGESEQLVRYWWRVLHPDEQPPRRADAVSRNP